MSVFEAARWAPSAGNEQPWRFIVARTPADREMFASFINPGNTAWCTKAPVLTVLVSKTTNAKGNPHNSHAFDAGTAWGYLALQAQMHGLIAHAMGGFDKQKARETLQIPDEYVPHAVIAIGYRGPIEALSEANQEREKPNGRKPLSEIMMEGALRPE